VRPLAAESKVIDVIDVIALRQAMGFTHFVA